MQANYSIVETTAPGDTRRHLRRLGSDKRRGELNARPVRGLRQKNLSIRTRDTRDIYAGHVCVPEKICVVTSELLSRNDAPTSRLTRRMHRIQIACFIDRETSFG